MFAKSPEFTGSLDMARPKKGTEKNASHGVAIRISSELRASLDELAERNDRSISDEMRDALERHVASKQGKRK